MCKRILKSIPVMCFVLIISIGCAETSSETVEASKDAEISEVVQSAKPVTSEDCKLTPPSEPIACTMQYDPVCGCNNKTYSNACMARAAGVPRSTPGPCEKNINH